MQGKRPDLPDDGSAGDAEVMGAYDAVDGTPAYLVADIGRDAAWLSVSVAGALDLEAWR